MRMPQIRAERIPGTTDVCRRQLQSRRTCTYTWTIKGKDLYLELMTETFERASIHSTKNLRWRSKRFACRTLLHSFEEEKV